LAYGVRETANITYGPLLQQLQQEHSHRLRLIPCVTAEPPADGYHGRITGALRSGQLERLAEREITPERSHFMLCGNQAMIKEATDLLGERGLRRHLRHDPGHISSEKYH
jgi:ferredoxin--NADP+ reductase